MPDLPPNVTKRAQDNDFVAHTGMLLSGITGFGIQTGFYLTNSGNYPISTVITTQPAQAPDSVSGIWSEGYSQSTYPDIFQFPSGKNFEILGGQTKFIPFDFVAVQNNTLPSFAHGTGPQGWGGPDNSGRYSGTFLLNNVSMQNGQPDPSGGIKVHVTGQVTGIFGSQGSQGYHGSMSAALPSYPSGFRVESDYGLDGKPMQTLRWYHPETGYFLTQYSVEYAGNIDTSTATTGSWSGLHTFEINYEDLVIADSDFFASIDFRKFATNTGINQRYTRGTDPQYDSNYGEYTVSGNVLGFDADYYYRIKSQYLIPSNMGQDESSLSGVQYESNYVYGYPVDNFNVPVSSNDVNQGLISGSTTLPAGAANSPKGVIANPAGSMRALYIYFENNQSNINLKTLFDEEVSRRDIDLKYFDPSQSEYAFTGVHFVVPEGFVVGSESSDTPGIQTGDVIVDHSSNEIDVVLNLEKDSTVMGCGGKGGDGGYTDIVLDIDNTINIIEGKIQIKEPVTVESTVGSAGSSAIKITSSQSKFRIRRDITSRIFGGGGGGGGGDPFFFPRAFEIAPVYKFDTMYSRLRKDRTYDEQYFATNSGFEFDFKVSQGISWAASGSTPGGTTSGTIQKLYLGLQDIVGTQLAGLGGGGQGFSESAGGSNLKQGQGLTVDDHKGSREAAGLGSSQNSQLKLSPGGAGGIFGGDGERALSAVEGGIFNVKEGEQRDAKSGGSAGAAIEVVSTNSNYSSLGDLVSLNNMVSPSNIPSLIAWFSTEDSTKFTCTTSGGYNYITKWTSMNSASIYMDPYSRLSWGAPNVPVFVTSSSSRTQSTGATLAATPQANSYTQYFNGHDTVFFGHTYTALEINNIVGSSKLEEDMQSFEIIYFFYPGAGANAVASQYSPWYVDGNLEGTFKGYSWRADEILRLREKYNTNFALALHQWSDIGGADNSADSYRNPSWVYTKSGKTHEGTGLPKGTEPLQFRDFTNEEDPQRAWMYSISSTRTGGSIAYGTYNDLELRGSEVFPGNSYSWLSLPRIGVTNSMYNDIRYLNCFYGCISDIIVLNKNLNTEERRAIYSYIASSKLKVKTSANRNNEADRNTLAANNGYAGFNLATGW